MNSGTAEVAAPSSRCGALIDPATGGEVAEGEVAI
jgi:hypothetical protein